MREILNYFFILILALSGEPVLAQKARVGLTFGGLSFQRPVCLATPLGDTDRLFVCEKGGVVKVIPSVTGSILEKRVFLDLALLLRARGEALSRLGEQGLLGLAFHPEFATNRQFYLFYSVKKGGYVFERVSQFLISAEDGNAADPVSELVLLQQYDQASNHNGGDLHFGPDGYLYISLGDEGAADDAFGNSQRISHDFFSGILRIDVDRRSGSMPPNPHPAIPMDAGVARFAVPADNPFVHSSLGGSWDGTFCGRPIAALSKVRTEFWAVGLRNPWRFSFDPENGDLWVGDVGQGTLEEVDVITRGADYGWALFEGSIAGPRYAGAPPRFNRLYHARPTWQYRHLRLTGDPHYKGNSVTGGVVYRGARFPSLAGQYIFGDYIFGNLWAMKRNASGPLRLKRIATATGIAAFGTDPSNGDVLMADYDHNRLLRLIVD